jgi:hypothetical protein
VHYVSLNHFSDFIQVLYSIRKHSTTNKYFPMHIIITTIYSFQEPNLNHGNYSEQELNMDNFVQANKYDVHMYAKFQDVCMYRYFYMNLTLFWLFSIYITYYFETILI